MSALLVPSSNSYRNQARRGTLEGQRTLGKAATALEHTTKHTLQKLVAAAMLMRKLRLLHGNQYCTCRNVMVCLYMICRKWTCSPCAPVEVPMRRG